MRERGLKYGSIDSDIEFKLSLPMRERGLKCVELLFLLAVSQSLPMRERGLKCDVSGYVGTTLKVAPHAGAWIEMLRIACSPRWASVAPHAGAWIEIRKRLRKS